MFPYSSTVAEIERKVGERGVLNSVVSNPQKVTLLIRSDLLGIYWCQWCDCFRSLLTIWCSTPIPSCQAASMESCCSITPSSNSVQTKERKLKWASIAKSANISHKTNPIWADLLRHPSFEVTSGLTVYSRSISLGWLDRFHYNATVHVCMVMSHFAPCSCRKWKALTRTWSCSTSWSQPFMVMCRPSWLPQYLLYNLNPPMKQSHPSYQG